MSLPTEFDPNRPTNSIEAAAKWAGVSRWAAYRQAQSGAWPIWRCGSRLLVQTSPFMRLVAGAGPDDEQLS